MGAVDNLKNVNKVYDALTTVEDFYYKKDKLIELERELEVLENQIANKSPELCNQKEIQQRELNKKRAMKFRIKFYFIMSILGAGVLSLLVFYFYHKQNCLKYL